MKLWTPGALPKPSVGPTCGSLEPVLRGLCAGSTLAFLSVPRLIMEPGHNLQGRSIHFEAKGRERFQPHLIAEPGLDLFSFCTARQNSHVHHHSSVVTEAGLESWGVVGPRVFAPEDLAGGERSYLFNSRIGGECVQFLCRRRHNVGGGTLV